MASSINLKTVLGASLGGVVVVFLLVTFLNRYTNSAWDTVMDNAHKETERQQGLYNDAVNEAAALTPLLEIQSFNVTRESGFAQVAGEVKNITGNRLENVAAVATFYDASGNFVKADQALISYDPLLPNQVSPFLVMTPDNPAIDGAKLTFKYLMGGEIVSRQRDAQ